MTDRDDGPTRGTVEHGGAEIAYDLSGTGDPLVLLHAGIADRRMWQPQHDAFAARYRVIRIDLRGFGETVADRSAFSHHDDVDVVLGEIGAGPAFVIGASLGAAVAVDLALHHPDRVAGLALIGPSVDGYRFEDPELLDAWERTDELIAAGDLEGAAELEFSTWVAGPQRLAGEMDRELRAIVQDMLVTSYRATIGEERRPDPPAIRRLGDIEVPTLVLAGTLDRPDILAIADILAAEITHARRVRVAGTAHLPNLEEPQRVTRLVLEFLDEIEAGAV